ncbi:KOW domain-containing RNA-binding protein [Tissierella sp. MB52-C2]|uniref:KOW domain-containing RNA-binding protein n=1 Tax=Tissierella sp. MB52-C2 TaxID=3070999 RepID=UPI00280C104B|nr:KOW domain-containing RNA-binding protein [Tissierella sp. MB52-C2]WMM25591.1 KOW domain-containing RNA-binding protein [Tissierella sp. MB52-C2]
MDLSDDVAIGQVVKSRAGRDKGKVFLVLEVIDNQNVLIVDGNLRKLDNPKQKKLKHLIVYNTVLSELGYKLENKIKINNAYIRKLLEPFNKDF